jgi:hypothetical protein
LLQSLNPYLPHFAWILFPGATPRGRVAAIVAGSFLAGLLITALGAEVVLMLLGAAA